MTPPGRSQFRWSNNVPGRGRDGNGRAAVHHGFASAETPNDDEGWHNGAMVERAAIDRQVVPDRAEEPEDDLVARVAADRRSGNMSADDVEELLRRAAERNKAALDRLAQ